MPVGDITVQLRSTVTKEHIFRNIDAVFVYISVVIHTKSITLLKRKKYAGDKTHVQNQWVKFLATFRDLLDKPVFFSSNKK